MILVHEVFNAPCSSVTEGSSTETSMLKGTNEDSLGKSFCSSRSNGSLLTIGMSEQVAAGIEEDFHEFVTRSHCSTTLLDGALRISCTDKEVQMKARLCPFNKFGQIAERLQHDKLVSNT